MGEHKKSVTWSSLPSPLQGLDSLISIMSGELDAAVPVPEANDPDLVGEAASTATPVSGGWGMGDEGWGMEAPASTAPGIKPGDQGGSIGDSGAGVSSGGGGDFSKVVTARRTTFKTTGQLDPLYLLEAVQVRQLSVISHIFTPV